MEYWSDGVMEKTGRPPLFADGAIGFLAGGTQHAITPLLQYSCPLELLERS